MKKILPFFLLLLLFLPRVVIAQLTFQFDSIIPSPQTVGDSFQVFVSCSDTTFTNWVYLDLHPGGSAYLTPTQILLQNGHGNDFVTIYRAQNPCSLSVYLVSSNRFYSNSFAVNPNEPKRVMALLPGETMLPGYLPARGRTGQPDFQTAGIPFGVDVYVTDYWWNPVGYGADTIHFVSDNNFPILPADTTVNNGSGSYNCILRTASTDLSNPATYSHIFVSNITNDTLPLIADTTSGIPVRTGNFSKLLLIAPSQSILAGDTTTNNFHLPGATPDSADWEVAGTPFNVAVYAVDDCWNPVGDNAPQDSIRVYGTIGPYAIADTAVLSGGTATVSLLSNVSNWLYLQATDMVNSSIKTQYQTPIYLAGAHYRLQADEENDTIISGDAVHLHITYEDENGNIITNGDHKVKIFVHHGSGTLAPQDTVIRDLVSGKVNPVVNYTTMQEEELFLEVASADSSRKTTPGQNVDPIYVRPNVTPDLPVVNYPNPFGDQYKSTTIYYYLPRSCDVTISIYDRFGNLVWQRKKNGQKGNNFISWNGKNMRGKKVANGAYLLAIRATYRTEIIVDYRRWLAVVK